MSHRIHSSSSRSFRSSGRGAFHTLNFHHALGGHHHDFSQGLRFSKHGAFGKHGARSWFMPHRKGKFHFGNIGHGWFNNAGYPNSFGNPWRNYSPNNFPVQPPAQDGAPPPEDNSNGADNGANDAATPANETDNGGDTNANSSQGATQNPPAPQTDGNGAGTSQPDAKPADPGNGGKTTNPAASTPAQKLGWNEPTQLQLNAIDDVAQLYGLPSQNQQNYRFYRLNSFFPLQGATSAEGVTFPNLRGHFTSGISNRAIRLDGRQFGLDSKALDYHAASHELGHQYFSNALVQTGRSSLLLQNGIHQENELAAERTAAAAARDRNDALVSNFWGSRMAINSFHQPMADYWKVGQAWTASVTDTAKQLGLSGNGESLVRQLLIDQASNRGAQFYPLFRARLEAWGRSASLSADQVEAAITKNYFDKLGIQNDFGTAQA